MMKVKNPVAVNYCRHLHGYWLQDSLTIFRLVTFKCPCSLSFFLTPVSVAAVFASSFRLCALAFATTPLRVTVWPTWSARLTAVWLRTSHVLPSVPVNRYSLALSPFEKQPVMDRTSAFDFGTSGSRQRSSRR